MTIADPTAKSLAFDLNEVANLPAPTAPAGVGSRPDIVSSHHQLDKDYTREIRLWDRSVLPLGGTSSYKDDFRAHPLPDPAPPPPGPRYVPNPNKLEARTTTADAYPAWPIEPPQPTAPPVYQRGSPHKFEGRSVTHEDYPASVSYTHLTLPTKA